MALEISGTILYMDKISYKSGNWFRNFRGGRQKFTHTHTHTPTQTHIYGAHFISLVFLSKSRKKTKKKVKRLHRLFHRKFHDTKDLYGATEHRIGTAAALQCGYHNMGEYKTLYHNFVLQFLIIFLAFSISLD